VIAAAIRARVAAELGLTCSVGVASTKFVAKLASTRCKPDGLLVIPIADVLAFLRPLPVTALWGVGARTGEQLHRLGIRTVADSPTRPSTRFAGPSVPHPPNTCTAGQRPGRARSIRTRSRSRSVPRPRSTSI